MGSLPDSEEAPEMRKGRPPSRNSEIGLRRCVSSLATILQHSCAVAYWSDTRRLNVKTWRGFPVRLSLIHESFMHMPPANAPTTRGSVCDTGCPHIAQRTGDNRATEGRGCWSIILPPNRAARAP
jgi:hypothetical protein